MKSWLGPCRPEVTVRDVWWIGSAAGVGVLVSRVCQVLESAFSGLSYPGVSWG